MTPTSRTCVLAAALILFCNDLSFAQQPPIGFVLKLEGAWLVDGQPLRLGQQVLAGSTVRLSPATPIGAGRALTIVLANNETFLRSCKTEQTCREGFALPASLNKPSSALSRLAAVFSLIFKEPSRYVSALSRGGRQPALPDAVVKLDAGGVDVALFEGISTEQYQLSFTRMPRAGDTTVDGVVTGVDVDASRMKSPRTITGLRPGLYKVLPQRLAGDTSTVAEPSWVLVDAQPHFDVARAAFDEAVKTADSWGLSVSDQDKRVFLRAFLDQLASQIR